LFSNEEDRSQTETKWEDSVEETDYDKVIPIHHQSPDGWAKLIRKLRWIGLAEHARRLELAVSTLPPEERGTVSSEPFNTN
jgi:hypothetical protein